MSGLIMKSAPAVGDVYRQKFSLANAEDWARVLSLTGSATVLAVTCNGDCWVTRDAAPFEPDIFETKYYAPGIGFILGVNSKTGVRTELVEVRN